MKVGLIGIGIVGKAILQSFTDKGITVVPYDKYKEIGSLDEILRTDIVFLCLPTPYDHGLGAYDKQSLDEVCSSLSKKYDGTVVIKSTVEPGTSQGVAERYDLNIIHNPEFLTANTAYQDFHQQTHIVLGRTSRVNDERLSELVDFYRRHYPEAEISVCRSEESEAMKSFCNSFYAVKIQFFNELYVLCQSLGIDYNLVREMMLKNNWINPMHTQVPGPDGRLSYGGMCFPKDTNALLSLMRRQNTPHRIMEATITERNTMRED